MPQQSGNTLKIPRYDGLAYWESRTAKEGGHDLRTMMERYAQTVWAEAYAEPPAGDTPSTVAMVALKSGHYYQVRFTAQPLECR